MTTTAQRLEWAALLEGMAGDPEHGNIEHGVRAEQLRAIAAELVTAAAESDAGTDRIATWAIVELFGHQKLAGKVSEYQIGGAAMLRVDVPEAEGRPAFTRFVGPSSVFSLTPVSEQVARLAVGRIQAAPITIYAPELQPRALPAASGEVDYADEF